MGSFSSSKVYSSIKMKMVFQCVRENSIVLFLFIAVNTVTVCGSWKKHYVRAFGYALLLMIVQSLICYILNKKDPIIMNVFKQLLL